MIGELCTRLASTAGLPLSCIVTFVEDATQLYASTGAAFAQLGGKGGEGYPRRSLRRDRVLAVANSAAVLELASGGTMKVDFDRSSPH